MDDEPDTAASMRLACLNMALANLEDFGPDLPAADIIERAAAFADFVLHDKRPNVKPADPLEQLHPGRETRQ